MLRHASYVLQHNFTVSDIIFFLASERIFLKKFLPHNEWILDFVKINAVFCFWDKKIQLCLLAMKKRYYASFLCGWLPSMRSSSFCEAEVILRERPNPVRAASCCEARTHSLRPDLILWERSHYMRTYLNIWGKTLLCEARPHSVRLGLILWGDVSFCEADINLLEWLILIPLRWASLFQQIVLGFLNFGLTNQDQPQKIPSMHACFMSAWPLLRTLLEVAPSPLPP